MNYIEQAVRTEAPDSPEMRARVGTLGSGRQMTYLLRQFIKSAGHLNDLKRALFYGKTSRLFPDLERIPFGDAALIPARPMDQKTIRLLHAAIGSATESGEQLEQLVAHIYHGEPLDEVNLIEEAGDRQCYNAIEADALGVTFEEIQCRNIAKLRARYPDKFTEDHACTRDLAVERNILEGERPIDRKADSEYLDRDAA